MTPVISTGRPTWVYLADVLVEIVNDHPNSAIDDLLPRAYASPEPSKPYIECRHSGL